MARVLLVDNDERIYRRWPRRLAERGHRVQTVPGVGGELLENAPRVAKDFRPHVAIVDLRLRNDRANERSGFELIGQHLQESSECIVFSANLDPNVLRDARRKYQIFDYVSKSFSSREQLLDVVDEAASQTCSAHGQTDIEWPDGWTSETIITLLFGPDSDVPLDLAEDILFQLFRRHETVRLASLSSSPEPGNGRTQPHSVVFQAFPDTYHPVIVKLASNAQIQQEIANFNDHVRRKLPVNFQPRLQEQCSFWDLGGVVFSSLSTVGAGGLVHIASFTDFYRQQGLDVPAIVQPLEFFFKVFWHEHYQNPEPANLSLFDAYGKSIDRNLEDRFRARLDVQTPTLTFPGVPDALPNPAWWALRHADQSWVDGAQWVITHGDLHGDNLIVDGRYAWVIDFERTGLGNSLRDFVELEVDLVARISPWQPDELPVLVALARSLVAPTAPGEALPLTDAIRNHAGAYKAWQTVSHLRSLAHEVTQYTDIRDYLWGLLLQCLYVQSITNLEPRQKQRLQVLSGVVCQRLSD